MWLCVLGGQEVQVQNVSSVRPSVRPSKLEPLDTFTCNFHTIVFTVKILGESDSRIKTEVVAVVVNRNHLIDLTIIQSQLFYKHNMFFLF